MRIAQIKDTCVTFNNKFYLPESLERTVQVNLTPISSRKLPIHFYCTYLLTATTE